MLSLLVRVQTFANVSNVLWDCGGGRARVSVCSTLIPSPANDMSTAAINSAAAAAEKRKVNKVDLAFVQDEGDEETML